MSYKAQRDNLICNITVDMEPNVNTRIPQRSVIEFLFKSVYGNETLDRSTIQRWVQSFQKGDFDLHDKERPGKPLTVTTDQNLALVEEIVKNNRTITTYQLMKKLSISKEGSHVKYAISYVSYIGETGRFLGTRLQEHKSSWKYAKERFAMVEHGLRSGHQPDWENTSTICRGIQNSHQRKFLEAIASIKDPASVNRYEEIPERNIQLLIREMMQTRKEICLDLFESYPGLASETFKGVITCDETWVYLYDSSSKLQSMEWTHDMCPVKKK
ncbi:hypothetical protein LAZ67_5003844 [Cordylochernes scorpioides]|uniref:Mos1 transposase HTH domain-containing protein n=1 Tax=Cordylochernes scorpioides TaxID=51811 RepID=A0ABY6KIP9_9ARAC|nr:hypothetical protein LAZ67_5003844 [Cordylochernes scorpioides]